MKKYLANARGVICSTVEVACIKCIADCKTRSEVVDKCPIYKNKRRRGIVRNPNHTIYLCTDKADYIHSGRLFKRTMSVYEDVFEEFANIKVAVSEEVNKDTKRLIHNLTSLNGHSIQELYSVVPQDILSQNHRDQIAVIKNVIINKLEDTAKMFIRIAKNNAAVKAEFAVFKQLYESNPILHSSKHVVRSVVMNVLYTFFQDFADQGIHVEIKESTQSVFFDYESIYVALYHLLENATKYVAPNSRVVISFDKKDSFLDLVFNMLSVKIEKEEVSLIVEEGYIGAMAKKLNKQGSGIGLNHVKRILGLNKCQLLIINDVAPANNKSISGVRYEQNKFVIRFDLMRSLRVNYPVDKTVKR